MYIHDATECAYKNGYKNGIKDFVEKLSEKVMYFPLSALPDNRIVTMTQIEEILNEMIDEGKEHLTMPKEYHFEIGV